MDEPTRNQLFYELDALTGAYDSIFIDHSSGIHPGVLQFAAACHQHVVVTTTEPTSYTDAYAIMKILSKRFGIRHFGLLVTMSDDLAEASRVIARFGDVARNHLDIRLALLDIIPWEPKLAESIRRRQPFVERYGQHELTRRLDRIRLKLEATEIAPSHGLSFFYGNQTTLSAR